MTFLSQEVDRWDGEESARSKLTYVRSCSRWVVGGRLPDAVLMKLAKTLDDREVWRRHFFWMEGEDEPIREGDPRCCGCVIVAVHIRDLCLSDIQVDLSRPAYTFSFFISQIDLL